LRVAIVGPESCGKTTLARALQARLTQAGVSAVCVDEYARAYYAERAYHPAPQDVLAIARGQLEAEAQAALTQSRVLLCDSTVLTCVIWAQVAFGYADDPLLSLNRPLDYDLTLLACADIPWAPDPLRSHPHERDALLKRYREALYAAGVNPVEVRGNEEARVVSAWNALQEMLEELPKI